MKSKFISSILAIAVGLAMVSVPVVVPGVVPPKVALASGNVTVKIEPPTTYVLTNASFTIDAVIDNPSALPLNAVQVFLSFDSSMLQVNSITYAGTPFTQVMAGPSFDNTTGEISFSTGTPPGTNTTATAPYLMTINMESKSTSGTTIISFQNIPPPTIPPRETKVYGEGLGDVLNWTRVVNGTVIIHTPELTVNVTPALKGDVNISGVTPISYPNTTSWNCDEVVNLTAVASVPNWMFDHWSGDLTGTTNPTNITMDSDKNVTAHFTPLYNLTVISDGCCPIDVSGAVNGTISAGENQTFTGIVEGENVTVSADDTAVCCAFDSWSDAGEKTHNITMDSDKSVTAYCSVLSYNLTVNVTPVGGGNVTVNGATPPSYPNSTTWVCGDNVTLNAVAASGYTFESSWSGNLSGNTTPVNITMDSDKSVTAHFTPLYNLTVTSDGCCPIDVSGAVSGTVSAGENQTFTGIVEGENVTVSADDTAVCCAFDSWSDAGEKTHNITMDSDKSVTAYCSVLSYNLTVNVTPVGGGNVTVNGATPPGYPNSTTWVCGDNVTLNAVAASGCSFDHWSGNLSGNTTPTNMTMYDNYSIVANFAEVTLVGNITFPMARVGSLVEPFVVKLFEPGNFSNVIWSGNRTTNSTGMFNITGLTPDTYDIGIKSAICVSEVATNITLTAGNTSVANFTMRSGDVTDDDYVDMGDYSAFSTAFNTAPSDGKWNANADLDRSGYIDMGDYSMFSTYFNELGDAYGQF